MTTINELLGRKRKLIQKKKETASDEGRDEIEREIARIDEALNLLDNPGPSSEPGRTKPRAAQLRGSKRSKAMTVFVYVNTAKQVGDKDHIKVFATIDAAEKWFEENDPEGVAFEYEVSGWSPPTA
jgi:hypothetical protein